MSRKSGFSKVVKEEATMGSKWQCTMWDHVELQSQTSQPVDFPRCVWSFIAPKRPEEPDNAPTPGN